MARKADYEVVIRPKGRSPADEYEHKGKTWIEGRLNSNYVIEITNHSSQRVLSVVSVDGVSVVDGQPASFLSRGYVLQPAQTVMIPGWLVNNQTAAQFTFSKMSESYSSLGGQDGNQGVIGVAWFEEQLPPMTLAQVTQTVANLPMNHMGNSILNTSTASVAHDMGTGFGQREHFATQTIPFLKASNQPVHVSLIYYDSASNLVKRGIKLRERNTRTDPQAFPANPGFCAPPPAWIDKKWSS
jgi:hypothetical protein